jgi:RNA polymerase sigma-70 factor, ECF subfamily
VLKGNVVPTEASAISIRFRVGPADDPEAVASLEATAWLQGLYDRFSDQVRDVALRHGGPGVDAEDIVQEVFLAAFRKRRELGAYAEPGGWLHVAAPREVWKARRRARMWRLLTFGIVTCAIEEESPDSLFERRELAEWVYAVLDRLPEPQRQAFLLSQLEGLSSGTIGRMLGCPETTIRSRIFLARRAFARAAARRRSLETEPGDER